MALPEGKTYDDKHVIGLFSKPNGLIGVIEVVRGYPEPRPIHQERRDRRLTLAPETALSWSCGVNLGRSRR